MTPTIKERKAKCEICQVELDESELEPLDCVHYACNKCIYIEEVRIGLNRAKCSKCFEMDPFEKKIILNT
jgi:hypothetical protein